MTEPDRPVLFLDFDGVILDSAAETAITAWRAGRCLWPGEWRGDFPSDETICAFRRIRPLMHTGYQAIGLLRVIRDQAFDKDESKACKLTNEEIQLQAEQALGDSGRTQQELISLFGETREKWIKNDFPGWLGANRFYPGVREALRERLAEEPESVYIITTKQERFVEALLEAENIWVDYSRIYGLDSGLSKIQVLRRLSTGDEFNYRTKHFIEDRLNTLKQAAESPDLAHLVYNLACWGYFIEHDIDDLRNEPAIKPLELRDFIKLLKK